MRTFIITLICLFSVLTTQAQLKDKGFFIEASAGYGQYKWNASTDRFAMIAPSIGYKFNPKWTAGMKMQIETASPNFLSLTGYAQYHYWCKRRLSLFGEFQATYASSTNLTPSNEHGEVGLALGGTFALTNRLGLILHYGYIGYSGDHYGRDQGACWNEGDFIVDADWRRLLFGVQFIF